MYKEDDEEDDDDEEEEEDDDRSIAAESELERYFRDVSQGQRAKTAPLKPAAKHSEIFKSNPSFTHLE